MDKKEFKEYVFEQKRQGLTNIQIAKKLGMDLSHFVRRLNDEEKKASKPITVAREIQPKPEVKVVSGAAEPMPEVYTPVEEKKHYSWEDTGDAK